MPVDKTERTRCCEKRYRPRVEGTPQGGGELVTSLAGAGRRGRWPSQTGVELLLLYREKIYSLDYAHQSLPRLLQGYSGSQGRTRRRLRVNLAINGCLGKSVRLA